jgi:large subunit ribosomal protein L18
MQKVELSNRRKRRTRYTLKKRNRESRVRMSVFRSNSHMYVQLIDDRRGVTLAAASTNSGELRKKLKKTSDINAAEEVGIAIARKGEALGIKKLIFDKGPYLYHGRVKALAEAVRKQEVFDF